MQTNSSLSTLGVRREEAWLLCVWRVYTRNSFSCKARGTLDKVGGTWISWLPIQIQTSFEFEWPTNLFLSRYLAHKGGRGMPFAWEKMHEKLLLMNSNGRREVRWRMELNSKGGLIIIEPT